MNNTVRDMITEIKREMANGVELDHLRDNSGEWIDSYLPIYNNNIITEWQNMPGDYDNRGATELGIPGDISIISLMQLDLYLYYSDLFNDALETVEGDLKGAI